MTTSASTTRVIAAGAPVLGAWTSGGVGRAPIVRLRPLAPVMNVCRERPPEARPRDDERPGHVRVPLASDDHPLWTARHVVRDECEGRVSDGVLDDLQIIVTELVANVLEHGDGPEGLAVDLTFGDGEIQLQVIGHGDHRRVPPFDEWTLPVATRRSGRGLALVRRLSRDVAVVGDDPQRGQLGWVTITASVPTIV